MLLCELNSVTKSKRHEERPALFPRTQSDFYYLFDTCSRLSGRVKARKSLIGGNPFSSVFYIMMKAKVLHKIQSGNELKNLWLQ